MLSQHLRELSGGHHVGKNVDFIFLRKIGAVRSLRIRERPLRVCKLKSLQGRQQRIAVVFDAAAPLDIGQGIIVPAERVPFIFSDCNVLFLGVADKELVNVELIRLHGGQSLVIADGHLQISGSFFRNGQRRHGEGQRQ